MKRHLLTFFLSLAFALPAYSQVNLEEIAGMLGSHRVKATFSCNFDADGTAVSCKGSIVAQDKCFLADINGLEYHCDGKCLVLVDRKSKEVCIEDASGLEDLFKSGIGNVHNLKFSELRYLDKLTDLSSFGFNTDGLGKEWVVTDLR